MVGDWWLEALGQGLGWLVGSGWASWLDVCLLVWLAGSWRLVVGDWTGWWLGAGDWWLELAACLLAWLDGWLGGGH